MFCFFPFEFANSGFHQTDSCHCTVELWFSVNCIPDAQAHGQWHWPLAACWRRMTLAHHITGWFLGRWWAPSSPWHQFQSQGLLSYLKWNHTEITWCKNKLYYLYFIDINVNVKNNSDRTSVFTFLKITFLLCVEHTKFGKGVRHIKIIFKVVKDDFGHVGSIFCSVFFTRLGVDS